MPRTRIIRKNNYITKQYYAVKPNGNAYTVHWYTEMSNGNRCFVPADGSAYGIFIGCRDSKEKCIRNAMICSHGRYDVVIFSRGSRRSDYVVEQVIPAASIKAKGSAMQ